MNISDEQIGFLHENGYLHIPQYQDKKTTTEIHAEVLDTIGQSHLRAHNTEDFYKRHRAINFTFDNPHLNSALLSAFSLSLKSIAEQVIDKAYFHMSLIQHNKSGLGHSIPWHQDIDPSVGPGVFYNFLFYPHDCDEKLGGLRVVPKSQRHGALGRGGSHDYLDGEITIYPKAGDLIIVDGITFHAVIKNTSEADRTSYCTRYVAEKIRSSKALDIGRYRTGGYDYAEKRDVEYA